MAGSMRAIGLVEMVKRDLETKLLDGSFSVDSRLPSERELVIKYKVSRNTIREAIQRLIAVGWLRSQPGAGVIVVNQLRRSISSPFDGLVTYNPALRGDILEFRRVLEGATAYFAAKRADQDDVKRIQDLLVELEKSRRTNDMAAEAVADVEFHKAIAKASHNTMFLHLQNSIIDMLREHITNSGMGLRQQNSYVSEQLLVQHQVLCKTICEQQAEEARTAMQAHIDFVCSYLKTEDN